MKIARTENFKKAWHKLTGEQKTLAKKAIVHLLADMRYPALRVKKIKGTGDIWEARVSISMRMTFQIDAETIILRNIGHHDETLDRP
jgi:mRNA interferase RelE/StbE